MTTQTTTTDLTAAELTGIAQFTAAMHQATALQKQTTLASLRNGSVARMKNAPRQTVIDEMIRILVAAGVK